MNRDDIIRMAEDVGMTGLSLIDVGYLERFAALVVAEKEKQTVNILERLQERSGESHSYYGYAIRVIKGKI